MYGRTRAAEPAVTLPELAALNRIGAALERIADYHEREERREHERRKDRERRAREPRDT